jgi:hypothetical protein
VPSKIEFRSKTPIDQSYELSVYGSCAPINKQLYSSIILFDSEPLITNEDFCVYTAKYNFIVTELMYQYRYYFVGGVANANLDLSKEIQKTRELST